MIVERKCPIPKGLAVFGVPSVLSSCFSFLAMVNTCQISLAERSVTDKKSFFFINSFSLVILLAVRAQTARILVYFFFI